MAPRSFGKYEVLARLATGGAASIFLARQPGAAGFKKLVCLKTLLPERAQDEDFVAMFLDEARLAARLNHPNCVQIYDLGRVRGVYYISMEFIFGETLWNLLTTVTKVKTPLPPDNVAHIIAAACDGLHHAHELKDAHGKPFHLVHRDVSPQNVMITFEGQTKVLDFGIAKAETGRAPTMAGIVKGKFSYMSPEQITGGQVDRRSDIYSLGIVMFECLASRRLYRGDSPEDIAKLILEHRAPRLSDVVPDIPPALDAICAKALSRHASRRYANAQQMGEAIRNYLDEARYNQSASNLGRLLKARFDDVIERRRSVFEGALSPDYDEPQLLEVLDARAVRAIDLFPEETDSAAKDFTETGVTAAPVLEHDVGVTEQEGDSGPTAALPAAARAAADTAAGEPSSSKRRGAGWQVEVESGTEDAVRAFSVADPGVLNPPAAEGGDATRVDAEAEGATVAGIVEPNDATQLDPGGLDAGPPLVQPAFEDDDTASVADDTYDSAMLGDQDPSPFDDRTPLDALDPDELRPPSFGGAAADLEARLAQAAGATQITLDGDATAGGLDPLPYLEAEALTEAPAPSTAPSPAVTPVPADPGLGFAGAPGPSGLGYARSPSSVGVRRPAGFAPEPEPLEPPGPTAAVPAVTPPGARFGVGALVVAVAFGISVGIVVGMLLARQIFGQTPQEVKTAPGKVVEIDDAP